MKKNGHLDITGNVYGYLEVIAHDRNCVRQGALWRCRCRCGAEVVKAAQRLKSGNVKSCGCYRREHGAKVGRENAGQGRGGEASKVSAVMPGVRYGRLEVLGEVSNEGPDHNRSWVCRCDCGLLTITRADRLAYKRARSCGCYHIDILRREARKAEGALEHALAKRASLESRQSDIEALL